MDCCHSGTGLDLPFTWNAGGWVEDMNPYHCMADVQMFSGCCDDQTSADSYGAYSRPGGAMTTAFCEVLRSDPSPTYANLMSSLQITLRHRGFPQKPMLTSTQRFEPTRVFLIDDILLNTNSSLGRTVRYRFPPRPRRRDDVMDEMMGAAAMGLGGLCCLELLCCLCS